MLCACVAVMQWGQPHDDCPFAWVLLSSFHDQGSTLQYAGCKAPGYFSGPRVNSGVTKEPSLSDVYVARGRCKLIAMGFMKAFLTSGSISV